MSEELINNVEKLIEGGYGDYNRLTAILEAVKKGRELYSSDRQYVDNLISKFLFTSGEKTNNNSDNDLQILKNRLAKGEITIEEFNSLKKVLEQNRVGTKIVKEEKNNFCGKCGEPVSSVGFCTRCTTVSNSFDHHSNSHHSQSNFKRSTYQNLALIGGIFGIVLTPIIAFSAGIMLAIGSALSSSSISPEGSAQLTVIATFVSITVSIIGIIVAYLIKKPRNVGIILIFLGIIEMFGTMIVYGVITWVLFLVAGIIAVRKRY